MSLNLCICDTEVVLVCCGCKVGVEIVRKNHGWGCLFFVCVCDAEVVLVCCGCKVGVKIVRKNHGWGCLLIFVSLTQRWCWYVAGVRWE